MTNNLALNKATVMNLKNVSGGLLEAGTLGIISDAEELAFTTTNEASFADGQVVVVLESDGIEDDEVGKVAHGAGFVPVINLDSSASFGDLVRMSSTPGLGTPHAPPRDAGDFAQVLGDGTTPPALLLGSPTTPPSIIPPPGLVWLGKAVASNSSELDLESLIDSTYDIYLIEFINIVPASNGVDLYMRVSEDNGANYASGAADYAHAAARTRAGATSQGGDESDDHIDLNNGINLSNGAGFSFNGFMKLYNPLGTSVYKVFVGEFAANDGSNPFVLTFRASYLQTDAINALRFYMSSGNIASGEIHIFGYAKS